MKNTVLPTNSRFLGPGISRELKLGSLNSLFTVFLPIHWIIILHIA